ncbi:hypothetical protein HGRIS_013443 [Hohenbuehelia grisea]|uniref:FACT complex subunit n=1 Tax=Hohenbuehelia grisea TaxID=104357 RepID=A0ABR3IVN9_9AGAR
MQQQVEINKNLFSSRLKRIYDGWQDAAQNEDYSCIADVDALMVTAGDPVTEDMPMPKGTCLQQWLLGYEFPSTILLFQKEKLHILCSFSKAKILAQIKDQGGPIAIETYVVPRPKDPPSDAFSKFVEEYTSLKRVGSLVKEQYSGKVLAEFEKRASEASSKPELVDMALAVSTFFAHKDEEELKCIEIASNLTSTLLKHHVAVKLETILDKEAKISHENFSAQIESRLGSENKGPDMKVWSKGKGLQNVDWESTEFCYPPIIQSRSTKSGYDLKTTAQASEDNIAHKGVLLVAFGMRYKTYCANVGRTFIVDPTPEQEAQYTLLTSLQAELLAMMKDGTPTREVYQHAIGYVREKQPNLEKHFVKNVGFGMGLEFRDSVYLLSAKNTRTLHPNMVFNLSLGFSDLTDANGDKYAMHLLDTVKVTADKAVLLTDGVKSKEDTMFLLNADDVDEKPAKAEKKKPVLPKANGSPIKHKVAGGKVLRTQTRRTTRDDVHQTAAAKLAEHQRELHTQLQEAGLAKYSETGGGTGGKEGKGWKKFQSYKGEGALPHEVERLRILVDRKAQSVIFPINGFAVPIHINAIKNVSKNDEGEYTYLRINFQTPGQLAGKKEDTPFEDPDATFVRSVTYRSPDGHRFDNISKQITELKKEANKREQQKKEMADVVEQDKLIELKNRRPVKLPEVFVRPAPDGKRLPGEVEIHQNGIRYQSPLGQKIDVLFSNVKHLFFQPCDRELIVIIHLHLRAPIMIGKKKTTDVQFFREASDVQFDETGNRKRKVRYGDEDEIEMEQQELKRRHILNKEFKAFAEKVAEAASSSTGDTLELDIPFRELSFEGVPFRTGVRLQPTTECLVHLTDPPFLVVTLVEIEVASLERVQYGLRQFDLVLIFKDFTKAPLHINSIASSQLDDVKNWLDSVDIPMSQGPVNLNWGPIMKTINDNPHAFFQEGGWSFLGGAGGEQSDHSDASETESEFAADSDDIVSDASSAEASDFSDASGSSGTGSDFGDGSEDSEGDDWDELERKAAKSDAKKAEGGRKQRDSDDSEDDRPKKKKPAANGKSKGKR